MAIKSLKKKVGGEQDWKDKLQEILKITSHPPFLNFMDQRQNKRGRFFLTENPHTPSSPKINSPGSIHVQ